jgi:hypothetical protein
MTSARPMLPAGCTDLAPLIAQRLAPGHTATCLRWLDRPEFTA